LVITSGRGLKMWLAAASWTITTRAFREVSGAEKLGSTFKGWAVEKSD